MMNVLNFIFFLSLIKCTADDVQHNNESTKDTEITYEPLSFSFHKDSFTHFRCNFNNEFLSHNLLKEPPFYISKSIRNFFRTFCLFFQYSQIKNNKEFRMIAEILFEDHLKKKHETKKIQNEFVYDTQTFIEHFERLENIIMNFLEKNDTGLVLVKGEKKRIVISQNNDSIEDFNIKLLEPQLEDSLFDFIPKKTVEAITDCYIKFKELYIQDLLHEDFYESLNTIHVEHLIRKNQSNGIFYTTETFYEGILNSYANLCHQLKEESISERNNALKFENYSHLLSKMYLNGKLNSYLNELIPKAKAKYFYNIYKNLTDNEDFVSYDKNKEKYILVYIKLLEKAFKENSNVYFINGQPSYEAFDNLIKNCLELAI